MNPAAAAERKRGRAASSKVQIQQQPLAGETPKMSKMSRMSKMSKMSKMSEMSKMSKMSEMSKMSKWNDGVMVFLSYLHYDDDGISELLISEIVSG